MHANFLSPLGDMVTPGFMVYEGLTANLTANTIALSLNYTEVRPSLYLTSGSGFKTLAASGDDLQWDGAPLAKSSDLNSKQDALTLISENQTGETTILQGYDTLTPISLHIAWIGTYTNVAGSHQIIPVGDSNGVSIQLLNRITNGPGGETILMTCD